MFAPHFEGYPEGTKYPFDLFYKFVCANVEECAEDIGKDWIQQTSGRNPEHLPRIYAKEIGLNAFRMKYGYRPGGRQGKIYYPFEQIENNANEAGMSLNQWMEIMRLPYKKAQSTYRNWIKKILGQAMYRDQNSDIASVIVGYISLSNNIRCCTCKNELCLSKYDGKPRFCTVLYLHCATCTWTLECNSCKRSFPGNSYTKTQLKKKGGRKCRHCAKDRRPYKRQKQNAYY